MDLISCPLKREFGSHRHAELYNLPRRTSENPNPTASNEDQSETESKAWYAACSLPPPLAAAAPDDDIARPLLMQAMENQYHGRYQATMTLVNENFAEGKDSLAGWAEFADDVGERRICLSGSKRAFEYKSLNYGKEQWITDDNSTPHPPHRQPAMEEGRVRKPADLRRHAQAAGGFLPGIFILQGSQDHGQHLSDLHVPEAPCSSPSTAVSMSLWASLRCCSRP